MTDRRYDIDWIRVVTIGLLLIYHIAIVFQPWGIYIGFIQNKENLESIWIPMSMLNVWRIPLLFFVSGMGVAFAIRKRNWKQLLLERSRRILIPLIFGILAIVPLHLLLFQRYYDMPLAYHPNPGHLWFLGNIFIYVLILTPLFYWNKKVIKVKTTHFLNKLFESPLGMMLIIASFVIETLIVKPKIFELYAMTWHGFILGFIAFFWGFCCITSGYNFLNSTVKWRWTLLIISLVLFLFRLFLFELKSPNYLLAIESNTWIFTAFGFASKYLNKPSKALSYLSKIAYPIYIWHMIFLYLGSFFILPLSLSVWIKLLLLLVITFSGCFAVNEFVINRLKFIKPLFGVK